MTPPDRWLDSTDPELAEARALLRAGLDVDPPAGSQDQIWASLSAQLSPPPDGPAAQPHPSLPDASQLAETATAAAGAGAKATVIAKGAAATLALKIGSVLAVVGGLAGAGALVYDEPATRPAAREVAIEQPSPRAMMSPSPTLTATAQIEDSPTPPAPKVEDPPAPRPAATPQQPARPHPANDTPSSLVPQPEPPGVTSAEREEGRTPEPPVAVVAAAERASRLREESALVGRANAALRAGDPSGALRLLGEAQARFSGGVLGQERAILTIEALAASGQRASASSRAQGFAARHPDSPYLTRLKPYLPLS